jgi:hypothetical protein
MTQPGDMEALKSGFVQPEGLAQANRQLADILGMRSQVVPLGWSEMIASLRQDVLEALLCWPPARGSNAMCRRVEEDHLPGAYDVASALLGQIHGLVSSRDHFGAQAGAGTVDDADANGYGGTPVSGTDFQLRNLLAEHLGPMHGYGM